MVFYILDSAKEAYVVNNIFIGEMYVLTKDALLNRCVENSSMIVKKGDFSEVSLLVFESEVEDAYMQKIVDEERLLLKEDKTLIDKEGEFLFKKFADLLRFDISYREYCRMFLSDGNYYFSPDNGCYVSVFSYKNLVYYASWDEWCKRVENHVIDIIDRNCMLKNINISDYSTEFLELEIYVNDFLVRTIKLEKSLSRIEDIDILLTFGMQLSLKLKGSQNYKEVLSVELYEVK